jgi:hypothetical protein
MVNTNSGVCYYRALSACMNAAVIEKSTSARSHPLGKISSIPIPARSHPSTYSWRYESVPVFRRTYLWFRANYAPEAGGVWKKGYSGFILGKFSLLTQKLSFWQAFQGVCRYRIFPVASKPQARKQAWILSQVSSLWCKLRPCVRWQFERRVILDSGYENSAF